MERIEKDKIEKLVQRFFPEIELENWIAFRKELELMVHKPDHQSKYPELFER